MKKQNVAANDAKKEQMEISELIKHMLIREKEQHGHSKGLGNKSLFRNKMFMLDEMT